MEKLNCKYCGKEYKRKDFLLKHEASCELLSEDYLKDLEVENCDDDKEVTEVVEEKKGLSAKEFINKIKELGEEATMEYVDPLTEDERWLVEYFKGKKLNNINIPAEDKIILLRIYCEKLKPSVKPSLSCNHQMTTVFVALYKFTQKRLVPKSNK